MAVATDDRKSPTWSWDELVLACDLVVKNNWHGLRANDPRVVELSDLLQHLPIHPPHVRGSKFRNPNGVARKTADLATHHPDYSGGRTKGGRLDHTVIRAFIDDPRTLSEEAAAIRTAVRAADTSDALLDLDLDIDRADEGRVLLRSHLIRERDPRLRARKIKEARRQLGHVQCEACGFDFERTYGDRGRDYIECHHKNALSQTGRTTTTLADLALVCSNCHRIIHRRQPWLSLDQLRCLVAHSE